MSIDINSLNIVGRLVRDVNVKQVGKATLLEFTIANNYRQKKGGEWTDETSFFEVDLWAKGEGLVEYMTKGRQVAVTGELRQERWEQDGQKRNRIKIVASSLQLLEAPKGEK